MMNFIGFLLTGLLVGLLARAIRPGRQDLSLGATTLLGIAGALIAGYIGRVIGWYGPDEGAGFAMSTVGALVVLAIYVGAARRRARADRDSTPIDRAA